MTRVWVWVCVFLLMQFLAPLCSYVLRGPLWFAELSTYASLASACDQHRHCIWFYIAASSLKLDTAAQTWPFVCGRLPSDILGCLVFVSNVFTARRYASALHAKAAIWPCPADHLSVRHTSVPYGNGWTCRAGIRQRGFPRFVLHCVIREFRYLESELLKLWTLPISLFFCQSVVNLVGRRAVSHPVEINFGREFQAICYYWRVLAAWSRQIWNIFEKVWRFW